MLAGSQELRRDSQGYTMVIVYCSWVRERREAARLAHSTPGVQSQGRRMAIDQSRYFSPSPNSIIQLYPKGVMPTAIQTHPLESQK